MAPSVLRWAASAALFAASQLSAASAAAVSASATVSGTHAQYTLPAAAANGQNVLPWINDPEAVDPQAHCPGYVASGVAATADGHGFTAHLDLAGPACNVYGNDVAHLALTMETQADDRVHIAIAPRFLSAQNASWFELPEALVPRPAGGPPVVELGGGALAVTWTNKPTFGFTVTRRATGDVLFSTAGRKLVYEDQFVEFGTALPADYNLYGLGEVIHGFRLGTNLTRTLFAADAGDPIDGNIYGTHPIYLDTRYFDAATGRYVTAAEASENGTARYTSATHGVFLRNAHAQEVLLRPEGLTWRLLGGSIDLYVYAGPTAEAVLTAYQQTAVGLPALQQYFAFGFHQCRWGYANWTVLQEVVDEFAAAGLPLETIWTDIDYMKQYRNFDNDPVRFGYDEAATFLDRLHANDQHYVPIVDSAVYVPNPANASDAYPPFDRGVAADAFLLNPDGSLYIGAVWPGYTAFPDWAGAVLNGTGAFSWWTAELAAWHKKVAFDGIWIDMSEVSSFCVGSCGSGDLAHNPVHPPFGLPGEPGNLVTDYPENFASTNASEAASASAVASSQSSAAAAAATTTAAPTTTTYRRTKPTPGGRDINYPPYVINNIQGDLAAHAVSPNATHHGGLLEYEAHNLFGHQLLNATHQALQAVHPGRRPLVIGRSTFAGSGKWAGHWGGDNYSKWLYMALSIPQALSFSIFGVPMFGVDTCGFNGNTDMELCARWMQLSAFFPFYRNHNTLAALPQEPYRWAAVADASRTAMAIRYRLLPYLYTLFADAHATGRPVMRALAWEFDGEPALAAADRQFLLGPALLVTPVLEQGAATVDGVFPGAATATVWYDWYNQTAVSAPAGRNVTLDAPLGHIPLFVRGGHILPLQDAANTTTAARRTPWSVLVALDAAGSAAGALYLDDGVSEAPAATRTVALAADVAATAGKKEACLRAKAHGAYADDTNPLANVTVLGVAHAPTAVAWNGAPLAGAAEGPHGDHGHGLPSWTYSAAEKRLLVTGLQEKTGGGAWSENWTLTWK